MPSIRTSPHASASARPTSCSMGSGRSRRAPSTHARTSCLASPSATGTSPGEQPPGVGPNRMEACHDTGRNDQNGWRGSHTSETLLRATPRWIRGCLDPLLDPRFTEASTHTRGSSTKQRHLRISKCSCPTRYSVRRGTKGRGSSLGSGEPGRRPLGLRFARHSSSNWPSRGTDANAVWGQLPSRPHGQS